MTATPRIYSESSKNKAAEAEATLCSMDDETTFGNEFHRLGFGEAVGLGLLSDYKVLVLAVDEKYIHRTFQKQITDDDDELKLDDAVKIVGCWNGLSKRFIQSDEPEQADIDKVPMKRAVAFCNTIKASKTITRLFTSLINDYQQEHGIDQNLVSCEVQHVDGTYNSLVRNERIDWLKAPVSENSCKILSNARCLAEGVDVPALDAVMFLNPRNSVVDVVQSVGRVMRKAENKNYGYIILPVGIPTGEDPTEALNNNKKYKIVWDVLQALRSHDDRFNSTINKIELNKRKPPQISVVGIGSDSDDEGNDGKKPPKQIEMNFPNLEEWKDAIYARIVAKCGDRRYWEKWGQDVANIAKRVFERINILIERDGEHKAAFREFLKGLRTTINPSVSEDEAIEMLAQHNITKPIFEALFENYSFTTNNPVSVAMEKIQNLLNKAAIDKETESLEKFYDSVRLRASKIDNGVGRQKVIVELYDKFFRSAFPRTVEKLGIVYTPVEVVDFIIHSVSDVLQKEFSLTLSDENIHILDGFTGTGTFITRLLQSGLIDQNSLQRKYQNEIYANEIVLLAYYIAAINIENVFHDLTQNNEYVPFEGICLTDTFQLGEEKRSLDKAFPENSRRIQRQQAAPIRVIIGNPPYSVGQRSANDNAQNQSYKILEERINETYAAESNANNKNSLYDSYIKAFRWATDKIGDNNGVIGFVSNGSWIEGNATDGFRKCLEREFSSIYIFNLRGNQRTSGELSRKEGGKIFGSGSRAPIAITLLVRNQGWNHPNQKATIYYHDIGDYLTREQKLSIIKERNSINTLPLKKLHSNEAGDWLNHRDDVFSTFIPLGNKHDPKEQSFFYPIYSRGAETGKDSWLYNFSNAEIKSNVERMINAYNNEIDRKLKDPSLDNPMIWDSKKIQWSSSLLNDWRRGKPITLEKERIIKSIYRPYVKECLYWGEGLVHRRAQLDSFFPKVSSENYVICVSGIGSNKPFSSLIVNTIPCLDMVEKSQCFPLYYYTENKNDYSLFAEEINGYIRHDALTDFILERAQRSYGSTVSKEDIFYYVYGILHSNEYRQRFESDLKKMLPRIPFVDSAKDFWAFSKAGRELANLHLEYENYASPENVEVVGVKSDNFIVQKMKFPAKNDKSSIIYNRHITIKNIPPKVYDYVVNGKSAVEWIMERYQITTDKKSKIKNDPNDWSKEHDNPRYILDLLLSVMTVSLETMEIVKSLPKLKFEETAVDSDKTEIIVSTIGENSN
jgi:predicted helicase